MAQVSSKTAAVTPAAAEHAASLAESGRCAEALPLLAKSAAHITDKELQKRVGLDGVRCATTLQQQDALLDFLRMLSRQFPHDPEVLYVLTHAYSDLSARAAARAGYNRSEFDSCARNGRGRERTAGQVGRRRRKTIARFWSKIRAIRAFISAWRGCCYPSQIRRRISPSRQRRSCKRNSKSIPRMPVRNTSWGNWRAKPRTYPRR